MASRKYLWALGGALLAALLLSCNLYAQVCTAPTPEQAVQQWLRRQGAAAAIPINAQRSAQPLGYAVLRIVDDPVLGAAWAQVRDCAHPTRPVVDVALAQKDRHAAMQAQVATPLAEQPRTHAITPPTLPMQTQGFVLAQIPAYHPVSVQLRVQPTAQITQPIAPMLVHAGDRVTLWNQEPDLQMNIAAVALEYGRAGQVIHLRSTSGFSSKTETIAGVVRGAGSVELLP